eukprot:CAMPEP_0183377542 /NCGR_PEP_ID=MMETSP0164_2-20130417/123311_1 /TAXON_ID=221442 /ORGANISM="Coccolithus pelagicus ssp braarudi, Strain PLY182g" /LENGTH=82 /DNA_ID=CAMNT_0025554999 /DNA_START=339 /DNA_END=587 /DNA_ORIENTATION=+
MTWRSRAVSYWHSQHAREERRFTGSRLVLAPVEERARRLGLHDGEAAAHGVSELCGDHRAVWRFGGARGGCWVSGGRGAATA